MQELLSDEIAVFPREARERHDLLGDLPLLLERDPHRVGGVSEVARGAPTPGMATVSSASSRYWTIIIAWFRSSSAWR